MEFTQENMLKEKDIREVKKALRRFFLIRIPENKTHCEFCKKKLLQSETLESHSLNDRLLKSVLESFLTPCDTQTSFFKCSLRLCHACKSEFVKLSNLFVQLEMLRVQFNTLRLNLGVKVIEESLGLSAENWREEVKQAEIIFPSCNRFLQGRRDVCIGTENNLEIRDTGNFERDKLQERTSMQNPKFKQTTPGTLEAISNIETELPDNVQQFWSMEDANLTLKCEEPVDSFSDTNNMEVINKFCSFMSLKGKDKPEGETKEGTKQSTIKSHEEICLFVCSSCITVFTTEKDLNIHRNHFIKKGLMKEASGAEQGIKCVQSLICDEDMASSSSSESCIIIEPDETKKADNTKSGEIETPSKSVTEAPAHHRENTNSQVNKKHLENKAIDISQRRSPRKRQPINYKALAQIEKDDDASNDFDHIEEEENLSDSFSADLSLRRKKHGVDKSHEQQDPLSISNSSNCVAYPLVLNVEDISNVNESILLENGEVKCEIPVSGENRKSIVVEESPEHNYDEERSKIQWSCQICNLVRFKDVFSLASHVQYEHENRQRKKPDHPFPVEKNKILNGTTNSLRCKICGKLFASLMLLNRHKELVHFLSENSLTIPCNYCDMKFSNMSFSKYHEFQKHSNGSIGRKEFQCQFCLKSFSSKQNMESHQTNKHFNKKTQTPNGPEENVLPNNISCFICGKNSQTYATTKELKDHEETEEHKKAIKISFSVYCNVCRMNFNGDADELKTHLSSEEHHQELQSLGSFDPALFCVPCRKHFKNHQEASNHNIGYSHDSVCCSFSKEKELGMCFSCPECSLKFNRERGLQIHISKMHSSTSKIKQEPCQQKYGKTKRKICQKTKRKHISCKICGRHFATRLELYFHAKSVHNAIKYKCDECDREFLNPNTLKIHIKYKHLGRPRKAAQKTTTRNPKIMMVHRCPFCSSSYGSLDDLKSHMSQTHTQEYSGNTPVFCEICFKCLKSPAEVKDHRIAHKNLRCPVCQKKSKTKQNLIIHMRIHTGERPYKCSFCEKTFQYHHNRQKHEMVHKNEELQDNV